MSGVRVPEAHSEGVKLSETREKETEGMVGVIMKGDTWTVDREKGLLYDIQLC